MGILRKTAYEDDLNPYIALADLTINIIIILAFFITVTHLLGRAGWDQIRYRENQAKFRTALMSSLTGKEQPEESRIKNDPPGVQRWVLSGQQLFHPDTAELTLSGKKTLITFATVLKQHSALWRRIRIEGHTRPPRAGEADDWELSCARAATVARVLYAHGHLPPYYLAVSGRAGQNPVTANHADPINERVEILIEYSQRSE